MPKTAAAIAPDPELRGAVEVHLRHIDTLIPYANNARTHSAEQIAQLAAAIEEFGFTNPLIADEQGVVAGHGRLLAVRQLMKAGRQIRTPAGVALPEGHVPVIDCSGWSEPKRRAYILWDNQSSLLAGWNNDLLKLELGELQSVQYDLHFTGFSTDFLGELGFGDISDGAQGRGGGAGSLAAKFGVPPFSVLNAREGWWQERKAAWLALGIRSELGRGDAESLGRDNGAPGGGGGGGYAAVSAKMAARRNAAPGGSPRDAANYENKARGDGRGRANAIPGGARMPLDRAKVFRDE